MKKSKVVKRRIKAVIELYNDDQVVVRYKKERYELPAERVLFLKVDVMRFVNGVRKDLKPVKGGGS